MLHYLLDWGCVVLLCRLFATQAAHFWIRVATFRLFDFSINAAALTAGEQDQANMNEALLEAGGEAADSSCSRGCTRKCCWDEFW